MSRLTVFSESGVGASSVFYGNWVVMLTRCLQHKFPAAMMQLSRRRHQFPFGPRETFGRFHHPDRDIEQRVSVISIDEASLPHLASPFFGLQLVIKPCTHAQVLRFLAFRWSNVCHCKSSRGKSRTEPNSFRDVTTSLASLGCRGNSPLISS